MKKLILSAAALLLSLGVSAQGYSTTGVYDDFASATRYPGIYYWAYDGGTTGALTIDRPGDGTLVLNATSAGGPGKYPYLAVEFDAQTLDLSTFADIVIDIENTNADDFTFVAIELEDASNVVAKYEPNVLDVHDTSTYPYAGPPTNHYRRKALNGFDLLGGVRHRYTIDLTNDLVNVGGLTATTAPCNGFPKTCPNTEYLINPSAIKRVRFQLHFGSSDLDLSEGDGVTEGDPTWDKSIPGSSITPFTGVLKIRELRIGNWVSGTATAVAENSLRVYPNPADAELNISFDATSASTVKLVDMLGNVVYTAAGTAGLNNIAVNTTNLTSGLYMLTVATEQGNVSRKVTIK